MTNTQDLELHLDEEGYLKDFTSWTEEIACALAEKEGVDDECPLSTERMEIVKFMRNYYQKFEAFPILRAVCRNVGQTKDCNYQQFPDPVKAWKIAGLPKPTPEVFAKIRTTG